MLKLKQPPRLKVSKAEAAAWARKQTRNPKLPKELRERMLRSAKNLSALARKEIKLVTNSS